MDNIVSRVTVVDRSGGDTASTVVYRRKQKRRKVTWSGPIERAARRFLKAQEVFGQNALRRQNKSNRSRREGWLMDAPVNLFEAQRKAYNEIRKAVPFKLLPRA